MKRLRVAALLACLLNGLGGQWVVLQSAGWCKMASDRAADVGFVRALQEAVAGQRPCHICHIVEEGTRRDAKPQAVAARSFVDFAAPSSPAWSVDATLSDRSPAPAPTFLNSFPPPPVPPPVARA